MFTDPGYAAEEIEPWTDDGGTWRWLVVTYPKDVSAVSHEQTYYLDDIGLIRGLDCTVNVLGGRQMVALVSGYRAFDGVMVPTRRRVYARDANGDRLRGSTALAIDIADARFS